MKQRIMSSGVRMSTLGLIVISWLMSVSAAAKSPNILLIMADDLGIGDIGCFGNDTIRTPNIDKLAKEGVRLTHDIAAASLCTPSRAAFQTGRYPIRLGMAPHNMWRVHLFSACVGGVAGSEVTIGELAKSRGYRTGFIGKWHLGMNCEGADRLCKHPLNQGYDYFYGVPVTNINDVGDDGQTLIRARNPNLDLILLTIAIAGTLFAYALRRFDTVGRCGFVFIALLAWSPALFLYPILWTNPRLNGMVVRNFDVVEQPIRLRGFTDRLVKEGVGFLQDQSPDKPFLLVMSWLQVHTALHATKPFVGRSAHGLYGDEVEEMDWSTGKILNALETLGFKDNTFVYFTSDNGGHLEEKGLHGNQEGGWNGIYKGGKGQGGMEGGIRVPTIVRWPGVVQPGSEVTVPTSHMDINPTVASIVGAEVPKDRVIDGKDIVPVLKAGAAAAPPHDFLVHYCGVTVHSVRYVPGDGTDVYKVFYVTHKYRPDKAYECTFICMCDKAGTIRHDPPLLYNIAKDPSEEKPLDVTTPANKEILAEVRRRLDSHTASIEPVESQFTFRNYVPRPWLQLCCNFPYCSCQESMKVPERNL